MISLWVKRDLYKFQVCIREERKWERLWRGRVFSLCVGKSPHNFVAHIFAFTGITAAEQSLGIVRWFVFSKGITHLQVPMDYAHLMAVQHSLQDLLNAMTACKHQGACVSSKLTLTVCTPSERLG